MVPSFRFFVTDIPSAPPFIDAFLTPVLAQWCVSFLWFLFAVFFL
jgi:hypothetical protein